VATLAVVMAAVENHAICTDVDLVHRGRTLATYTHAFAKTFNYIFF
jgi:hypothetical protein